jgi:hypothetical protein
VPRECIAVDVLCKAPQGCQIQYEFFRGIYHGPETNQTNFSVASVPKAARIASQVFYRFSQNSV